MDWRIEMTDLANLRETITPKSDRINADDFIAGPETVEIIAVKRGDADSPVAVHIKDRKPWYPCKSMRRVLITAYGDNGADWVGKSATLFCDPAVRFGGVAVGGIRIAALSHIDNDLAISLTTTRGKRSPYTVKKLEVVMYPIDKFEANLPAWHAAIKKGPTTAEQIIAKVQQSGKLTPEQIAKIKTPQEAAQ
jgi:hypothetical protein